jgi:hypothetical protein
MIDNLKKTRKADRKKMADAIANLANEFGFAVTERREEDRSVRLNIRTERGLSVSTDIHPHLTGHLGHWYISGRENVDVALSDSFEHIGSRNTYHFHKATSFAGDFEVFLDILRRGFVLVKSGEAFK